METAISVQSLSKRFGMSVALDDVSFDVPAGSVCGLIGPNGAGKTTLFSIAAGFLKPTEGTIRVLDVDLSRIGELRGRFAMLPQDAAFQRGIPVVDQLVMFGELNGYGPEEAREHADRALDLVGLKEYAKRSAATLSHGMFKRVALCQAFIGDPEVIVLDEPTSGLDPDNARKMRELMTSMHDKQTLMISSHNLREVQDICDHVVVIHKGKLVDADSMAGVTKSSLLLRIEISSDLPSAARDAIEDMPFVEEVVSSTPRKFDVRLNLEDPEQRDVAVGAIQRTLIVDHDVIFTSFHEGASLETRFLQMTGGTYDGASST